MCNNPSASKNLIRYTQRKTATVGDGTEIMIDGKGHIDIVCHAYGRKVEATLRDVSLIPSLVANLFSIPVIIRFGMETS